MIAVLVAVLALALWLILRPPRGLSRRVRRAFAGGATRGSGASSSRDSGASRGNAGPLSGAGAGAGAGVDRNQRRGSNWRGAGGDRNHHGASLLGRASRGRTDTTVSLIVVVQQLAALLKGGRTPSRLWDELWVVYAESGGLDRKSNGPRLNPGSAAVLAAARGAAMRGSPVAEAIRLALPSSGHAAGSHEPRIWAELAACFDIAEASGCPLAEVLTRFAAQLEVEDDAEAARQTALAGPKATVTLLTWLPLLGLGLGICLGVDPLAMLVGTPLGVSALIAGTVLTVAGRIWSARLVRAAAGAAVS
jgi:tight adherence protein B